MTRQYPSRAEAASTVDVAALLPAKFETEEQVRARSEQRQRVLRRSPKKGPRKLARRLKNCSADRPCKSAACPRCFRDYRLRIIEAAHAEVARHPHAYCVTIVMYDEHLTTEELPSFNLRRLKLRLWRQLKRSGFVCPVFGGFEMDYHTESKIWLPHFHLVMFEKCAQIEKLRKQYYAGPYYIEGRSTNCYRPVMVQELNDRRKQLSYPFKSYWSCCEAYREKKRRKRRTQKHRLQDHELRQALRTLDRLGFGGILFLYQLRWNKSGGLS